jgi:N-sulfoglucosamine sulfohydrolase
VEVPAYLADTPAMRQDWADYLTTIQYADACVGAVMRELEAAGRLEDTLVIFTADQGYAFHRAKATAYDAGLRVPLIVRAPDGERGTERGELVSHVDLMPTILQAAGMEIPENVQGRALQPLLQGERDVEWREVVFGEHNSHGPNLPREYYPTRSAFDGRFHYLVNLLAGKQAEKPLEAFAAEEHQGKPVAWTPQDCLPGGPWGNLSFEATLEAKDQFPLQYELLWQTFHRPPEELYDLHSDPGEMRNLAGDARVLAPLRRLRQATERWQEESGDPGLALKDTPRREPPQPS